MSIFTANRLSHAQNIAAAFPADPRWVKTASFTDSAIAANYVKEQIDRLPALATRWLVENHAPSGAALHGILMDIVNNPDWVTTTLDLDSHFWERTVIWECAVAFDICKSLFSQAEQDAFAAVFETQARRLLFEYSGVHVWGDDTPGSNYFYGPLMFWPMSHALAGRPFWDDLQTKMRARYDTYLIPWFDGEGKGGIFCESTNYESVHRLSWILDCHRNATGEDLFGHPWFVEAARWAQHRLMPGDAHLAGIGDQPVTGMAELNDNTILRMMSLGANMPATPERARLWDRADRITWPALRDNTNVWQGVLYAFEQDTHARSDYKAAPLGYKAGLIYTKRASWDSSALCLIKNANDIGESHQERACPFKAWLLGAYPWASIVQRSHGGSGDPWSTDTIVMGDGIYPDAIAMYWNGKRENTLEVVMEEPVTVLKCQQRSGYWHPPLHAYTVDDNGVNELWDVANGLVIHYERFVPIPSLASLKRRRIFQTGDDPILSTSPEGRPELTAGDSIFGSTGMMKITWLTPMSGFQVTPFPPEIDGRVWCHNVEVVVGDLHAYAIQFYPKGQTPPLLNTVLSWDGHEAIVQSVTLTAPAPTSLPPIADMSPPPNPNPTPTPIPAPTPRQGGTMQANFATTDADHIAILISGLPTGVTIKSCLVTGVEDTRWTWSFPSPPNAPVVINGMTLTFEKNPGGGTGNPNSNYTVQVVGSDNQSETVQVGASGPVPSPSPPPPTGAAVTLYISGSGATLADAVAAVKAAAAAL